MGDSEDPVGINDKIEILSTDDQRIKAVGELLSSDSSRTILQLLFNEHMTANQIAQKTETSLPLVMYHLKKMQDAGVVSVSSTGKNTKSHNMKYYTVDKFAIVILPSGLSEKAKSSKSLHNSFNRIYRFATIGGAALATWFSSQFIQHQQTAVYESSPSADSMMKAAPEMAQKTLQAPEASQAAQETGIQMYQATTGEPTTDIYLSIIVTLSVVVVGLIIERIIRARKK
ncbi:helix-turn-helix domain-containing protein [Candidatus Nitrosotenuis chungbukensis]|uniref:winged helix-turn-helix domain-containing protein n=1 Tax=Candidatus Nitrosotenuis chungbukensis TaxID=1353246 RepID=UPI0005B2ABEF|nr:winged helix-turn-helix domain-containing protein [Candidatus Nitrosotenuis chungbukensis]WKT57552.1 helix-turn-helix domain-containing protein [Candidatus Nitrosotenuis chungbukensis]